jgi:hypothetical protein
VTDGIIELNAAEAQALADWQARWDSKSRRADWQRELASWARFSELVDEGFRRGTVDDYYHYLSRREALEELRTTAFGRIIEQALADADDRFRRSTVRVWPNPLREFYSRIGTSWWWERMPMTGPLASQLGMSTNETSHET